jgi:UDP-2-acetamido-3-amino-2,3-dideoxy-glucuronate N-acetyltransferase
MTPTTSKTCDVRGVRLFEMSTVIDAERGHLTVGEFGLELPFIPRRYFVTYDIPDTTIRGEHAHWRCEQFLLCLRGHCWVQVDDGYTQQEFLLDSPTVGIYVPPMVWATEYKHSADSRLMVFASHSYDPADYIRDYAEFLKAVR